jgi:hypothetical protein
MTLKPGNLVTLRKFNISTKKPMLTEMVYADPTENDFWLWSQGEIGIFLEMEDPVNCCSHIEMAKVLHNGRIGWIYEELLRQLGDNIPTS